MISNLKSPVYVQVELTSDCNNRCLYCYNFWRCGENIQKRKSLSNGDWGKVATILGENDIFYVTVTGGEPFLEKEKIYNFLNSLYDHNIRIMINSNATLIKEDDAEKLVKYPIEIFLASIISHDAERHNMIANSASAFEKTVQGIKLLQKYGINVAVNMVATKLNYGDIYNTGKWLYNEFGIKNFSATPICPSSNDHSSLELNGKEVFKTLDQLICLRNDLNVRVDILEVLPTCLFADNEDNNSIREIVKIFSKRMCTAGNTTMTIGSEGDVRVCSFDNQSYGNILGEDFSVIWNRMQKWRDNSFLPQECKGCDIVESCGGGCRVNSKVKKGTYCELDSLSVGAIQKRQNDFFSEISDILMDSRYSFLKNIFFRKEKDDIFLAIANSMYFIIINGTGLKILQHLIQLDYFIPDQIVKSLNFNPNVGKKFFAELFNKGFIMEVSMKSQKGGGEKWLWNYQKQS